MTTPFGSWRGGKQGAGGKPTKRSWAPRPSRYRHAKLEPLELRELLSGNTYVVNDTSDSPSSSA